MRIEKRKEMVMSFKNSKKYASLQQGYTVKKYYLEVLGLKGVDLMIYSIIASFSNADGGRGVFTGSIEYLIKMTGFSKSSVCRSLKRLYDDNLILRGSYSEFADSYTKCYRVNAGLAENMIMEYGKSQENLRFKEDPREHV